MIIVIANQKGGVGKSTIATNLAASYAASHKVTLIDHDTSHVSWNFHQRRQHLKMELNEFEAIVTSDFDEMVYELDRKDNDVKVVDLGGFTDDLATAAMVYADIIIVPTSTSTHDMDGNIHFMETLQELRASGMKTSVYFVANNISPHMKMPRVNQELDYIIDRGYEIIGVLPHYVSFSTSHGMGMGMVEFAEQSRPAKAVTKLSEAILEAAKDGK